MGKEENIKKEKNKKFLALLMMFFPTLLIIAATNISNVWTRGFMQLGLAFFQLVIIKNFLDDQYFEGD
jgi:ACR3 family arsenite efflux pump ArsB